MINFKLPGHEKDKLIFLSRRHWVYHLGTFVVITTSLLILFFITFGAILINFQPLTFGVIVFSSCCLLLLASFAFREWTRHNYEVLMLTVKDLVEVNHDGILNRRIIDLPLKTLTNVSARLGNFFGVMFGYGDLVVELNKEIIIFPYLPQPLALARAIINARNKAMSEEIIEEQGTTKTPVSELAELSTKSFDDTDLENESVVMLSKERLKSERVIQAQTRVFIEQVDKTKHNLVGKPKGWWQIFWEETFLPPRR